MKAVTFLLPREPAVRTGKKQGVRVAKAVFACLALGAVSEYAPAMGDDDPRLTMVRVDQLEYRATDGSDPLVFQGEGWVGHDLDKIWFKADVEHRDGSTEDLELQALYSRAVAPYWDFQAGLRQDFRPEPERTWAAFGFEGLAPYWFDVNTALFVGESGRTAMRVEAQYDLLFTQRLILSPQLEVNFYGKNDGDTGSGSGLSDTGFGLRLRYEIRRQFAPYLGVNWQKKYGNTADYARNDGESVSDASVVVGLRAWF